MNIETFIKELKKLNIDITEKELKKLNTYKNLLQEYNQKFNLTTIIKDDDIYLKHFYDSLTITKVIDLSNQKLLDIGTGAGFPGLVLKIFYPNLDITLLDSNNKKIAFLNEVINKLELKCIKTIHGRAEDIPKSYRNYFDIVTSRAVSHLRIISELSIPYLKVNGYLIAMKGNIDQEMNESESTLNTLNSKIEYIESFNLPIENSIRNIIKIKKVEETLEKYPRTYNEIKKKIL